jgi:hypothetical protein
MPWVQKCKLGHSYMLTYTIIFWHILTYFCIYCNILWRTPGYLHIPWCTGTYLHQCIPTCILVCTVYTWIHNLLFGTYEYILIYTEVSTSKKCPFLIFDSITSHAVPGAWEWLHLLQTQELGMEHEKLRLTWSHWYKYMYMLIYTSIHTYTRLGSFLNCTIDSLKLQQTEFYILLDLNPMRVPLQRSSINVLPTRAFS